jgi:hypothetical protein
MPLSARGHADERMVVQAWRHDVRVPDRETDIHLSRMLADMEHALENCAEVTRETQIPGFVTISVVPRNPNARAIWLSYMGDQIILEAGEHGGRWELERTPEDVALLVDVVESIAAGRVRETVGPRRSMVEVTLADGRTIRETGYDSLRPRPGWKRRGRLVQYEAYTT